MIGFRSIVLVIVMVLINTEATRTKANFFDPVLSSNAYIGHVQENERVVQLEPRLYASDADPSNSPNGKICGYELSLHKHDDLADQTSEKIPFIVELNDAEAVIKMKANIKTLDCEIKQTYELFIRAYDCANDDQRRYSDRASLIVILDDVNEFAPVFTHPNYLFKLHRDQTCSACRVEATDDDCGNVNHAVCDYQITTANIPFGIDSNGSISITEPLTSEKYEFDVVAIDCFSSASNTNERMISEPAKVTITIIKSCKPSITDNNPTKLTIHSDHTHLFDTVHIDVCDDTCAVEDLVGTVTLETNGIDSGCNAEQCSLVNREYVLIEKDSDENRVPEMSIMSFDGITEPSVVNKKDFSGRLNKNIIVRLWMKHFDQGSEEKEHVFCKSDAKLKNRHHLALFLENGYLKFLIRHDPLSSNDQTRYASEWMWKVPQINDDQWHSYKLFVNYPEKIDLYIDDELVLTNAENFKVIEDHALPIIDGTEDTVFTLGACWHGRASAMAQSFHGQLSGLTIEQKEEIDRSVPCVRDCQQYLDMPDVQSQADLEFSSNSNRSVWILRADSSESFEQLLKHIVYRNTLDPIGPSGQRTVSIQTTLKCLGENYTYNLPLFSRRLSIDEVIRPANIELKGDTNFFTTEEKIRKGIYIFRNLSIYTDDMNKDQVDISDCSVNTTPELSNGEELIVPDENIQMNNLDHVLTRTGLVLSGLASIDSYQFILQQISFVSKSPLVYLDRTFSLVCVGMNEHVSTNEVRVQVHVEKQLAPPVPVAAVASNKLYVSNEQIRDNLFDIDDRMERNVSGWPIAVVICVSLSVAGVLVLYLVTRIRSGNRQRSQLTATGDDVHSQMEWEDDIGLNIIVNPLDQTKKSVQTGNAPPTEQTLNEYEGTSSEFDDEDGSQNEYSDEDEDEDGNNQIYPKKPDHQLEWDDEEMDYGPKRV